MTEYRVAVGKEALAFAAAHFITFGAEGCEPLHGHNYRVGVEVGGSLDRDSMVYDFVALQRDMRSLLGQLDHRVILPTANPALEVEVGAGRVDVRHATRHYVFPETDVALLPIPNTTAERIAEHLGRRMQDLLGSAWGERISIIAVEVEEAPGQSATWTDESGS